MRVRIICNGMKMGGAERSICTIVRLLKAWGTRDVTWHPTTERMAFDPGCKVGPTFRGLRMDGDVLLYCTNNSVLSAWDPRRSLPAPTDADWNAEDIPVRIMLINWEIGGAYLIRNKFTHFAFLSTALRDRWVKDTGTPLGRTFVHAPAVDLEPFRTCVPDYEARILARHSYKAKWPADATTLIMSIRDKGWKHRIMGLPIPSQYHIDSYPADSCSVPTFLDGASAYWYPLRPDYREQGPRTIVEAMAAGLPCFVDNRDGPRDRVRHCGWLLDHHSDYARTLAKVSVSELMENGQKARERAFTYMDPNDWVSYMRFTH